MPTNIISKVIEIENCNKDDLIKAVYKPQFWECVNPAKKMEAHFVAPNVLYTKVSDEIINIQIKMEGELVLSDKGEQLEGKGRLIGMNVRNNKDVSELEGHLRIKAITPTKSKVGVFINNFKLSSGFLNLIGKSASELTLRRKITEMLRNLDHWLKQNSLDDL